DFSQFGGGAAVAATNNAGTWTATYVIAAGAIDAANRNVSVTATDNAGNTTTTADTSNATVDSQAPTVTDANISIGGASGTGGAFKVGDTVTVTWNNTAGGDNNADITGATVDFSQFGGGAAVAATNNAGTWTATYVIAAGAIDAANRNVSVTATDNAGNTTTTADTSNATVDSQAPVVTDANISIGGGSGTGGAFKAGDTVTVTWNNTAGGDNNVDSITGATVDFSQFGGGAAVAATNNAGTWTATYVIAAGAIDAANRNVSVTATDNAGNTTTTADTTNATVDSQAPTVTSIVRQTPSSSGTNSDTLTYRITFSEAVTNLDATDFTVSGTTATVTGVTSAGGNSYDVTVSGGDLASLNGTVTMGFAGGQNVADSAGNTLTNTTPTGTSETAYTLDNTAPTITSIVRQTPSTSPTNSDTLVYRITFSEAVGNLDVSDFAVSGTTATVTNVAAAGGNAYDVTLSGGDLAGYTGVVTLSFAGGQNVTDGVGNALASTPPTGTNESSYTVDNTAPTVVSVSVPANATYQTGQNLDFTVTFAEAVTVDTTGGTPRLALDLDGTTVYATYQSGSGGTALTFRYTVQVGHRDLNGIAVAALQTNGGTIRDASANDATATLNNIGSTTGVNVDGVNDAPSVTNGATHVFPTIDEDTHGGGMTVVAILASAGYADADNGALSGIAVTASADFGTWQYSTDGATWTNFGTVSDGAALLLSSTTQIRYVPDAKNGETATFSFRAWDQTTGTASTNGARQTADATTNGGSSAFSTGVANASITVTAVNDAPTVTNGATHVFAGTDEDTTTGGTTVAAILASAGYADVDGGALSGIAVTAAQDFGTWQYSLDGNTWANFRDVSESAALLLTSDTLVRYVPDGAHGETATFSFRAWDRTTGTASGNGSGNQSYADTTANGGSTAFSTNVAGASIAVSAINDAPVVTAPATIEVIKNKVSELPGLSFADADASGGTVTVTLSAPTGIFAASSGSGVTVGGTSAALTLTGTVADINAFMSTVTYKASPQGPAGTVLMTVTIDDGGNIGSGGSLQATRTVALDVRTPAASRPDNGNRGNDQPFTPLPPVGLSGGNPPPQPIQDLIADIGGVGGPNLGSSGLLITGAGTPGFSTPGFGTPGFGGNGMGTPGFGAPGFGNPGSGDPAPGSLSAQRGEQGGAPGTPGSPQGPTAFAMGDVSYVRLGDGSIAGLSVSGTISQVDVGESSQFAFNLPEGLFAHSDPSQTVTVEARQADGSPLPAWLRFDPASGTFVGEPPAGEEGIEVEVIARDANGAEASVRFELRLDGSANGNADGANGGEGQPGPRADAPAGKPSLSAQLKAAGQGGMMAEAAALLESLMEVAGVDGGAVAELPPLDEAA
ncbi:MAG TPA: hypothetical protein VGO20_19650, partial [Arenibaculum sp.]|nr:hypothetical protein [Arenibaculum sp.]